MSRLAVYVYMFCSQAASHELTKTSQTKRKERQRQIYQHYEQDFKLLEWMSRLNSSHHSNKSGTDDLEPSNPSPPPQQLEQIEFVQLEDDKLADDQEESTSGFQKEVVDQMCLGFSKLLPIDSKRDFEKTLLIVSFDNDELYEQLPMIDVIYRTHFRNILYCGYPHASLNTYLHKLQLENRTISYLPAVTPGYECLVGAMEMDYHVDGYLLASAHSLLLPESLKNLDKSMFWYGTEEADNFISKRTWRDVDPGGKKIPRIMASVVQALKFVAHLVGVHEEEQHGHDSEVGMDDEHHSSEEVQQSQTNKTTASEAPPPEEHVQFELHLHAEGVTPLTNLTDIYTSYGTGGTQEHVTEEASSSTIDVTSGEVQTASNETVIDIVSIDKKEQINHTYIAEGGKPHAPTLVEEKEEEAVFIEYDVTSPLAPEPVAVSELPVQQGELVLNVSSPDEPHPEYLDTKPHQVFNLSLADGHKDAASINPVEDESRSLDIESSNNYAKRTADESVKNRTRRKVSLDSETSLQENRIVDGAFRHIEELIRLVLTKITQDEPPSILAPYVASSRHSMRLDPREFKHLRCGDQHLPTFYTNKDLCTSLRQFFSTVNELFQTENGFLPSYNHYPVYYVPLSQQKAFYLLANVFLQFGVPDQVAVPLVLRGLANDQVHQLKRTYFGSDAPAVVEPSYPLFEESANYLFPVYLQRDLHGDKRLRTIFCLKYLYSILS